MTEFSYTILRLLHGEIKPI